MASSIPHVSQGGFCNEHAWSQTNEYYYINIIHFVRCVYKEGPEEAKRTLLHKIVQDEAKVVEAM